MESKDLIFIVEDDAFYASAIEARLELKGYKNLEIFLTGKECIKNIYKLPKLVILDYNLKDSNGKEVLKELLSFDSDIPIIFLSGQVSIQESVDVLKLGAYDYIQKNDDTFDKLDQSIDKITLLKSKL